MENKSIYDKYKIQDNLLNPKYDFWYYLSLVIQQLRIVGWIGGVVFVITNLWENTVLLSLLFSVILLLIFLKDNGNRIIDKAQIQNWKERREEWNKMVDAFEAEQKKQETNKDIDT